MVYFSVAKTSKSTVETRGYNGKHYNSATTTQHAHQHSNRNSSIIIIIIIITLAATDATNTDI